ncbi:uncharacterized protein LOC141905858 isoform X2 [Tubulanus polymorphus]|uniref:uncharacterized protein LOC141905858 isoform X2 n=1 Tax=Tubulanus polymorphus TaxID=672921 RepID=UPI003DA4E7F3
METANKRHGGGGGLTVFDAVKAGMLIPVQSFVQTYGVEILRMRDEKGHTVAHWAALGGHTTILRYIIEVKGPIDEASDNELAQHPIHWACVNGHIAVVEILLQCNVLIDVMDNKGCTPLIVSCQYGKTMLAGYLMGKGARLQLVDQDGDTALHWAAFKGFSELMRLLIYSGFDAGQLDNYGQTPLHLACINGNLTAVRELVERDGVEINLKDKNGKSPYLLACGRKHQDVIKYLDNEIKKRKTIVTKINMRSIIFGPPGKTKGPFLFFLVNLLLFGYPMYIWKAIPLTWPLYPSLHVLFILLNVVMWISLYQAYGHDPGFLPQNVPEYDMAIKQVAHYDEWKQGINPLSRLCHTCRTVKPLRSKHCRICNRCVKHFDHHCPYIYNCVGHGNRVWFLVFVCMVNLMCLIAFYMSISLLRFAGWNWLVFVGTLDLGFFSFIGTGITAFTINNMLKNITTNEYINYKRYSYLKDANEK